MELLSIATRLPRRIVTNDEVLERIRAHSTNCDRLPDVLRAVSFGLKKSGSQERRWLSPGESAFDLTMEACHEALCEARLRPGDIDWLIYASVYKEMREPSSAARYAYALGANGARAFDLTQACAGWLDAAEIVHSLFAAKKAKRIMVITSEFPMTEGFGIYPNDYEVQSFDQLEHRLPGFTVGEAAAVTIFEASENQWNFLVESDNSFMHLCNIPEPWWQRYDGDPDELGADGPSTFTSFASRLSTRGFELAIPLFRQSGIVPENVAILFTHCSSKSDWQKGAEIIGLCNKHYDIYQQTGNVVSAGIPVAMHLALAEKKLQRGDKVCIWSVTAGMAAYVVDFTY